MRYVLLAVLFLLACAQEPVVDEPFVPQCGASLIVNGTGCCLDADDSGVCDAYEETPEEPSAVPFHAFHVTIAPSEPPSEVAPGDSFKITMKVENTGNVPLVPNQSEVRLLFANPVVLGLRTIADTTRHLPKELAPGETTRVSFPVTLSEEFRESSMMIELRFCYHVARWDDRCTATRKVIAVEYTP